MVDGPKHCFEAANRDCGARPLPNQLCGGTKKVLRTFFARAFKPKSEVEIETASTDFCLLAQWLIAQNTVLRRRIGIAERGPFLINWAGGTKKVLWIFFARALKPKSEVEIKLFELLISVSWRSG